MSSMSSMSSMSDRVSEISSSYAASSSNMSIISDNSNRERELNDSSDDESQASESTQSSVSSETSSEAKKKKKKKKKKKAAPESAANSDINKPDANGDTPIVKAAYGNQVLERFKRLVEMKADVNARDPDGMTVLQIAACETNDPRVIRYLVEARAELSPSSDKLPPLAWAISENKLVNAETLLQLKADPNNILTGKGQNGNSVMHLVARQAPEFILKLIKYGGDVRKKNNSNMSAYELLEAVDKRKVDNYLSGQDAKQQHEKAKQEHEKAKEQHEKTKQEQEAKEQALADQAFSELVQEQFLEMQPEPQIVDNRELAPRTQDKQDERESDEASKEDKQGLLAEEKRIYAANLSNYFASLGIDSTSEKTDQEILEVIKIPGEIEKLLGIANDAGPIAFVYGECLVEQFFNLMMGDPKGGIVYGNIKIIFCCAIEQAIQFLNQAFPDEQLVVDKNKYKPNLLTVTHKQYIFRNVEIYCKPHLNEAVKRHVENFQGQGKEKSIDKIGVIKKIVEELESESHFLVNGLYAYKDNKEEKLLVLPATEHTLSAIKTKDLRYTQNNIEALFEYILLVVKWQIVMRVDDRPKCQNMAAQVVGMELALKKFYAQKMFLGGQAGKYFQVLSDLQLFKPFFRIDGDISKYDGQLVQLFRSIDGKMSGQSFCHHYCSIKEHVFAAVELRFDYTGPAQIKFSARKIKAQHRMEFIEKVVGWPIARIFDDDLVVQKKKPDAIPAVIADTDKAKQKYYKTIANAILDEMRTSVSQYVSRNSKEYPLRFVKSQKRADFNILSLEFIFESGHNLVGQTYDLFILRCQEADISNIAMLAYVDYDAEQEKTRLVLYVHRSLGSVAKWADKPWTISPINSMVKNYRAYVATKMASELGYGFGFVKGDLTGFNQLTEVNLTREEQKQLTAARLNESQTQAAMAVLKLQRGYTGIIGPYGTGKTRTIVAIVGMLYGRIVSDADKHVPIIVCAEQNAWVQNCYELFIKQNPNKKAGALLIVSRKYERESEVSSDAYSVSTWCERQQDFLEEIQRRIRNILKNSAIFSVQEIQKVLDSLSNFLHFLQERNQDFLKLACVQELKQHLQACNNYLSSVTTDTLSQDILNPRLNSVLSSLETVQKNIQNLLEQESYAELKKQLHQKKLVFVTASTLLSGLFEGFTAHTIFLEEATRLDEANEHILYTLKPQRIIHIGDPRQLGPHVLAFKSKEAKLDRSLMERLQENKIPYSHLLITQYRGHPTISQIPNKLFYKDELQDDPGLADRKPEFNLEFKVDCFLSSPCGLIDVRDGQEQQVTLDEGSVSYINKTEANLIMKILDMLFEAFADLKICDRILIISMYKGQKILLLSKLAEDKRFEGIEVGTVDSVQGREKDIVFVSTVRTKDIGFINDPRRLNVSLSRARHKMFCFFKGSLFSKHKWTRELVEKDKFKGVSYLTDAEVMRQHESMFPKLGSPLHQAASTVPTPVGKKPATAPANKTI